MLLQRLWNDRQGAVSFIVGFGILMLTGAVGVAVDVARGQMAQTKLQNALDAAGLAAGASVNSQDMQAEVTKYMNVNFAEGTLGATITNVTPVLSQAGQLLTVTATASMPTTFMNIFGHSTMQLRAETEVTRSSKGMELAMVLDITGSMCSPSCSGRLDALKTASYDLLDILFGENEPTADNLWVGIVPFSMAVNIGNSHTDWLQPGSQAALDWGGQGWRGCTEARWATGNDLTDANPATERFMPYYWADDGNNNWREVDNSDITTTTLCGPTSSTSCRCTPATGGYSGGTRVCTTTYPNASTTRRVYCSNQTSTSNKRCYQEDTVQHAPIYTYDITSSKGPNTYCPTNAVTRLTNQRSTLDAAINSLTAVGGTHIPTGAVWGWRLISPLWRGYWGGSMNTNNLPLDYNSDLMIKAMILMTDGQNTMYDFADGAYGYTQDNHVGMTHKAPPFGASDNDEAAEKLDEKLGDICTNMKQRGVIVYVVVFDVADANVVNEVKQCASQPDYYFNAPDAAALRQSFSVIGDSLANLRISR